MDKIKTLIGLLVDEVELPEAYQDHPLKGGYSGFRDAHIEPDWILIYEIREDELILVRTGTHSDLF